MLACGILQQRRGHVEIDEVVVDDRPIGCLGVDTDPITCRRNYVPAQSVNPFPDKFGVSVTKIIDEEPLISRLDAIWRDGVAAYRMHLGRSHGQPTLSQRAEIVRKHLLVFCKLCPGHHRESFTHNRPGGPGGGEHSRYLAVVDDVEPIRSTVIEGRDDRCLELLESLGGDHANTDRTIEMISAASSSVVIRGGRN